MTSIDIARGESLTLTSYGNGLAYRLYAPDFDLFVQDDDATELRARFDQLSDLGWSTNDVLRAIASDYAENGLS